MIIGEAGRAAQAVWGIEPGQNGKVYGGGGSGGGGKFEMDPAELKAVIGLWEDQLKKITEDGQKIRGIADALRPPGHDDASGSYVSTGGDSIAALQAQNDSMKAYVQGYLERLREAQSKTVKTDHALAGPLTQAT
ncbi:hypothetical protein ACFWY9_28820 [Amycolatopsis sp. NPDC059027]|uniref:hypothetical protein n=1 Tax=unclassified Amycolatopsis TaxID=2618356 RepID=UPI00366B6975